MEDKFSNKAVSRLLKSISTAYLLKNENRFKIIAYERAADVVDHLSREIKDIWVEKKLEDIPGIGKAIASYLDEYFKKGHSRHFDQILKNIPETVFILMEIPTIGPRKAFKLVKELNLLRKETVVEDLKRAALERQVAEMENFGKKSEEDILQAIEIYKKRAIKEERMILPYAFSIAEEVIEYLKKNPAVKRVDALGSLRRMVTTIGDIDLATVVDGNKSQKVIDYFVDYPKTIKIDNAGAKKASIIVTPNIRVDLRIQEEKSYGSMLQYFTGSKNHNIELREYALKKGLSLSEYGIKDKQGRIKEFRNEKDFYNFLGLQYIPAEIREGTNEMDLARKKQIPTLVKQKDIKGDLHIHSSFDLKPSHDAGTSGFDEIIKKAGSLKYEYIGLSDHNPKSSLMDNEVIALLKKRKHYVDKLLLKKSTPVNYFIGLEVDIFPNGHIALPKEAIQYLDYLIVSVHSVFNLSQKEMTKRVLEALKNPKVKILGHPTGRYLGKRDGFELEWEKIFEVCRENNIALEINSWPERLDLPDLIVQAAVENKVKLIISSDAHHVIHMDNMFYGVSVARRGWAKKPDIINTRPFRDFKKWLTD